MVSICNVKFNMLQKGALEQPTAIVLVLLQNLAHISNLALLFLALGFWFHFSLHSFFEGQTKKSGGMGS